MSDRAQEMLCKALDMAEKSAEFFKEAIGACGEGPGKEVFNRLLEDERFHMERIKEIQAALVAGATWMDACLLPEEGVDSGRSLKEFLEKKSESKACTTEMGAIGTALEMEKHRVDFFEEWLRGAEDPTERKFVERMVQEERGHFILLSDLQYFYEDPRGWSLKEDHQILDGA
jgi:rubrerythrin